MKTKCLFLLSSIAFLFLPVFAGLNAQPANVYLTQTFRAGSSPMISATTSGGNITFEQHDRDEVVIHVIARKGREYLSVRDNLEQYVELSFNHNGDQVSVEAKRRTTSAFSLFGRSATSNVSVSYHIFGPAGSSTEGSTSGGNISLSGFDGAQQLQTSGGNISLAMATGEIRARTSGGNIRADRVSGTLEARTSGGHINLNESSGRLSVRTSGGNISIRDVSGSVEAQTSGGNITANVHEPGHMLNLSTSGGNVTLNLPAGLTSTDSAGLNLNMRGNTASMQGNLQGEMRNSSTSRNSISGTFGRGATDVNLRTSGGRVTLTFE